MIQGNEIQNRTSVVGGFTAVPSGSELKKIQERLKEPRFHTGDGTLAAKIASGPYPELGSEV